MGDYENILNAMYTTGVYVVREDNHRILYFNKRMKEITPDIEKGMLCYDIWTASCSDCPLYYIKDKEKSSSVIYNEILGQEVDMEATRILWEETISAFLITVIPHAKIYNGDLETDMPADINKMIREKAGLERMNSQSQNIIQALADLYYGVYIINLSTKEVKPVHILDEEKEIFYLPISNWDVFLSKIVNQYYHPECREEVLKNYCIGALKDTLKKGEKKTEFLSRRKLNGSYRYISIILHFYTDSISGNYAILAMQNVDERIRQEIRRTHNDKRIAAVIKSRYDMMNTVYLDTGVCERVYLDSVNELSKVTIENYDFFFQTDIEEVLKEDIEKFQSKLSFENLCKKAKKVEDMKEEIFQYRLNGPIIIWMEAHILFNRQEKNVIVNILNRDVTREKLKEMRDKKEKREKSSIINSLSSLYFATYYVDLESNLFHMVVQKEEVGNTLGIQTNYSEGIHTYAESFVHPEDREEYTNKMNYENLLNTLSFEQPTIVMEYRRIKKTDGNMEEDGWIRATIILAESFMGKPIKALYVAQDVTETKEKEEREHKILREACEAAVNANASKSDFLSRMSHDIRTPMNAIIGMTTIASANLDDRERVSDCLNKITVSSRHLLSLINEVLDMSRIESGKFDLEEEEFNLSDLIQNFIAVIRPSVEAKHHDLKLHITKVEHEDVIGDVMRLQQVFVNILENAVKYTPDGGRLELIISEKTSDVFGYGCYEFIFKDNGIGMSEEFVKQIYEPFSRAEDSRVSKVEGSGLGMTITMNIVNMMNGNINIESQEGKGSQFTVTVFLKQQTNITPDIEQFVNLPVLVVDDDICSCESTCAVLDEIGMKSEWVQSGKEAVERVRKVYRSGKEFFVIIIDWKMAEMDGLQTARQIRKEIGKAVPIIISSAYDWSSIEAEARQITINGFISKPLFKSRLVFLLKKIAGEEIKKDIPEEDKFSEQKFHGKRILLADDNEINREIAREIIESTGVKVESVENGRQALERFRKMGEGYYDLIFMDIQMPIMNGWEATKEIRKIEQKDASQIPIIAMTANAFTEDIIASKKSGMNEHITKPLDIKRLMECMRYWFEKREIG